MSLRDSFLALQRRWLATTTSLAFKVVLCLKSFPADSAAWTNARGIRRHQPRTLTSSSPRCIPIAKMGAKSRARSLIQIHCSTFSLNGKRIDMVVTIIIEQSWETPL